MVAWILSALAMLGAAALSPVGRGVIAGATTATALDTGDIFSGAFNPLGLFDDKDKKKRRRRRRALTASDRADIGFIAATLGQPAGKAFALVIASRITG